MKVTKVDSYLVELNKEELLCIAACLGNCGTSAALITVTDHNYPTTYAQLLNVQVDLYKQLIKQIQ
jgi:hypothetical protein